MHIPDGFLDAKTALATSALAAGGLAIAMIHARTSLPRHRVPLLGVSAAFVFAAQMVNFPVAGGTSGHLVGGVLAAALLGPSAAVIALTAVLVVQCFAFADGGITALGANILNMGVIGVLSGWAAYYAVSRIVGGMTGRLVGVTVGAWLSTVLAATACAAELAVSRTLSWSLAFPAMAGIHMLIGVGEAIITAMVLASVWQARPALMHPNERPAAGTYKPVLAYGAVLAMAIALFLSPFASPLPDGLDSTSQKMGFAQKASEHRALAAPIPDYRMPGISRGTIATSVAGGIGTIAVFGLGFVLARLLVPKPVREGQTAG